MTAVTGAAPKNYYHSSDYRAGDHHQALLLESAGRQQVPIPDRHNSSTEEFRWRAIFLAQESKLRGRSIFRHDRGCRGWTPIEQILDA
jgi:hypothetical protein